MDRALELTLMQRAEVDKMVEYVRERLDHPDSKRDMFDIIEEIGKHNGAASALLAIGFQYVFDAGMSG